MTEYFWLSVQGSGQPDGHPFHGQLTVVKKGIRCPVPSGCIAGSRVQLTEVRKLQSYRKKNIPFQDPEFDTQVLARFRVPPRPTVIRLLNS